MKERYRRVIEEETEEALNSDDFFTSRDSCGKGRIEREIVDRWATKESKRQGINPDDESKRRISWRGVAKAIRFPLMSQHEFALVVIDSRILTLEEVGDMMKNFSDVSITSLPFLQAPRNSRIQFHRWQRSRTFI